MCTFKITNYNHDLSIDKFLKLGGPTVSKTLSIDDLQFTHNLLSITGDVTPQPIVKDNYLYMLLGEIYNYNKSYPSDIYSVIENYELYKNNFTNYLDGEFLIIVYDIDKKIINFYTDPWSTKMVWYDVIDNYFYFGTFKFSNNSKRLSHNSHYSFYIENNLLEHTNSSLHTWDLFQYKNNYDDWENSFIEAVKKRYHKDMVLALSGGLDSSAIAACLKDLNFTFDTISLLINEVEDTISLESIYNYIEKNCSNSIFIHSFEEEHLISKSTEFLKNKNLVSYPLNILCTNLIKNTDKKVLFTGHGSDEIIDNYIYKFKLKNIKLKMPYWYDDLHNYFPYDNFYENRQRILIDLQQYVSLANGLETRNPFLDKKLVQEWLWVSSDLKNKEYKGPIKHFLSKRGIFLSTSTTGLGDQSVKLEEFVESVPL